MARALGRKFERISVGGLRDEAEIRGHRRTYIGAMPGVIIRALRDAGVRNPLLMIDEIDKMGSDFRGDPSSAMLEVLDPEQNHAFRDHYLDLPFDLSDVMFVCTANTLDTIPGPLRDRMEVIQLAGLHRGREARDRPALSGPAPDRPQRAQQEPDRVHRPGASRDHRRLHARGRRTPARTRDRHDLPEDRAGRSRRGAAKRKVTITEPRVRELLGKRKFFSETRRRTSRPGVATGLAWTPVGGEVLFIEATAFTGSGRLTITGQLGDVMQESAQAALSYVRSNASDLVPDLPEDWFATHDIHIHVPAGATPKDGPSAGVAMVTALVSLLSGRPVRADVAMTGEITLTGQVLPIGGSQGEGAGRTAGRDPHRDRAGS